MIRRLIFVLSPAAINAHAQTPDLQSEIDELRRLIHTQSESINELSGKVEFLQKSTRNNGDGAAKPHKNIPLAKGSPTNQCKLHRIVISTLPWLPLLLLHLFDEHP